MEKLMQDAIVSIAKSEKVEYPCMEEAFRPGEAYPEYLFDEISKTPNYVYAAVRDCFRLQGLDIEHYGTADWNPLRDIIRPGDNVLIKPNLVIDRNLLNGDTECLYTHPSVVACVVDYIILALGNSGKIIIGDAPIQECDFVNLLKTSGYQVLIDFYKSKGYDISIVDFRELTSKVVNGVHIAKINEAAEGTVVNLGMESEFYNIAPTKLKRMRITNYDPEILPNHHNETVHEYYVSNYMLQADVIINMPKPKSHRKAGATISLKNFVGVNIRKEYLPHHTRGSIAEGGDEYEKKSLLHKVQSDLYDIKNTSQAKGKYKKAAIIKWLIKGCSIGLKISARQYYSEGSWYGNHTISKTVSDINKIVYYADKKGEMKNTKQRKIFIVADMIKAGEGEGPIVPSAKPCGVIAMGTNPVCFDEMISTLMGFDYRKIPTIINARGIKSRYTLVQSGQQAMSNSNMNYYDNKKVEDLRKGEHFCFVPSAGWKGHIEI